MRWADRKLGRARRKIQRGKIERATAGVAYPVVNPVVYQVDEVPLAYGSEFDTTINVGDGTPMPVVEGAASVIFRVSASRQDADVTFDYQTVDGTAIAGTHYTGITTTSGTITLAAGFLDIPVTLATADALWEIDRYFMLQISNALESGQPVPITKSTGNAVITDSLAMPAITITSFLPNPAQENTDPFVSATVDIAVGTKHNTRYDYTTEDISAKAGVRYTAKAGMADWVPGILTEKIDVPVLNPLEWYPDETLKVKISNYRQHRASDGFDEPGTITVDERTATITSNDPQPTVSVGNGIPNPAEQNIDAQIQFTISLTDTVGYDVAIDYQTQDNTAVAGQDYEDTSGTFTINAGQTSGIVNVAVLTGDTVVGTESFNFIISNARIVGGTAAAFTITADTGVGNIKQNFAYPAPTNLVATKTGSTTIDLTWDAA